MAILITIEETEARRLRAVLTDANARIGEDVRAIPVSARNLADILGEMLAVSHDVIEQIDVQTIDIPKERAS